MNNEEEQAVFDIELNEIVKKHIFSKSFLEEEDDDQSLEKILNMIEDHVPSFKLNQEEEEKNDM